MLHSDHIDGVPVHLLPAHISSLWVRQSSASPIALVESDGRPIFRTPRRDGVPNDRDRAFHRLQRVSSLGLDECADLLSQPCHVMGRDLHPSGSHCFVRNQAQCVLASDSASGTMSRNSTRMSLDSPRVHYYRSRRVGTTDPRIVSSLPE
jgi:hypothetical protein